MITPSLHQPYEMKSFPVQFFVFFILLSFVAGMSGCKKEPVNEHKYVVGETYGGGIVFYVDYTGSSGKHGLIAAPQDQQDAPWGCQGTDISTDSRLEYGQSNTTAILQGCPDAGIAARICDQLILNGFSDWFLPSKDELLMMRDVLYENGLGNFMKDAPYWSSTQTTGIAAKGLMFNHAVGNDITKQSAIKVRAIRAF